MADTPAKIDIYTDGGYFQNRDIGGWGCVIYLDGKEVHRENGWKKKTSSLEMELVAAQQALLKIDQFSAPLARHSTITLHTDSRILIEGLQKKYSTWCENDWKVKSGKTVIYKPLWQELFQLTEQKQVNWSWVKGHNGNAGNQMADQLARSAVEQRA